jgi:hypothetical protein
MDSPLAIASHARLLRALHLAVLRFALTRENADRLSLFAVAGEIDKLGGSLQDRKVFAFFRKTSGELSAAILRRDAAADAILRRYLAAVDDVRLRKTLCAALEFNDDGVSADKRRSAAASLWRGLASRQTAPRDARARNR